MRSTTGRVHDTDLNTVSCRNRVSSTPCVAQVQYFLRATVSRKEEKQAAALACGLPTHKPILLAVCELREVADVGFKIPLAWVRSKCGRQVFAALRGAGVGPVGLTPEALLEEFGAGAAVFQASQKVLSFDGNLTRVGVDISSDVLLDRKWHANAMPVEPVVMFDPRRYRLAPGRFPKKADVCKEVWGKVGIMKKQLLHSNMFIHLFYQVIQ